MKISSRELLPFFHILFHDDMEKSWGASEWKDSSLDPGFAFYPFVKLSRVENAQMCCSNTTGCCIIMNTSTLLYASMCTPLFCSQTGEKTWHVDRMVAMKKHIPSESSFSLLLSSCHVFYSSLKYTVTEKERII